MTIQSTHRINLSKLADDVLDKLLAALVGSDVEVEGLALDAVLLRDLLCVLLTTLLTSSVGDGDSGAHLGAAAGSLDTHTLGTGSAGDDDDFALEAEEVLQVLGIGDGDRHGGGGGGGGKSWWELEWEMLAGGLKVDELIRRDGIKCDTGAFRYGDKRGRTWWVSCSSLA